MMSTQADRVMSRNPGEIRISLADLDQFALLGGRDAHLRLLEDFFSGTISVRGDSLLLRGSDDELDLMARVVLRLIGMVDHGQTLDEVSIGYVCNRCAGDDSLEGEVDADSEPLFFATDTRRAIRSKTAGQSAYIEAIRNHDVVFSIGPGGTGKTYLAVVLAMDYLKRQLVDRVVLVRPAVEAGEQLGFLPGDLQEKIDPYLRPLYDALSDTIGPSRIQKYMGSGIIEAAPLAYMRGRTLNKAFVILDEAQNTTLGQMKMFLTRLGYQSKAVVTGDITQIDLRGEKQSGLVRVRKILEGTEGVSFVELGRQDVVRHPLVRRIVEAFRLAEEAENGKE